VGPGDRGGAGSKRLAEAPTRGLLAAALLFRTVGAVPRPVCVCVVRLSRVRDLCRSAWRVLGMPRSNRLSLSVSMRSCRASRGRRGCGVRPATQRRTGPFAYCNAHVSVHVSGDAPLPRTSRRLPVVTARGSGSSGRQARPTVVRSRYRVGPVHCRSSRHARNGNHSSYTYTTISHTPTRPVRTLNGAPLVRRRTSNFPISRALPVCALCSLRCQRLTFLSEASQRRRPCRGGRAPRSAYWRRWRRSALPRH
jgi:hypothetical protein